MRIFILTTFVLFATIRVLYAGGCDGNNYAQVNKSKQEIVLISNNLQLLKYSDHEGATRFTILNLDGTVLSENMSRIELKNDFPEIEKKFKS